ncbi:MAG TPA: caspase family protein [Candidatus Syntrophosphaera sp.]|nr:caspase family protein [Candidatus Syntrophosphaera sp.]
MKRIGSLALLLILTAGLFAGLELRLDNGSRVQLYSDYYALIIGNSEYQNFPKLRGVKQDVQDVKAMFEKLGVRTLLLENQTGTQMQKALNDFVDVHGSEPDRALILYYAGHGYTEQRADGSSLGYIVPVDAPLYTNNRSDFRNKSVSMSHIIDLAELARSKHVLMLFDSCFSGTLFTVGRGAPQNIDEKTTQPVRQFITAGSADEMVPDRSIFKTTLVRALGEGFADLNQDGYVTGTELGLHLEDSVVNYSRGAQHPKYGKIANPNLDRGDFVFALATLPGEKKTVAPQAQSTLPSSYSETLTGSLRVTSDFEAEVCVDKVYWGTTWLGTALIISELTVGEHVVELFTSAFKTGQKVLVTENSVWNLDLRIADLTNKGAGFGSLILNSQPSSASVTIGGYYKNSDTKLPHRLVGTTPYVFYDKQVNVYAIELARARYQTKSLQVTTDPLRKLDSQQTLTPLYGSLKLTSSPSACRVLLNGIEIGRTPLELTGESQGLDQGTYLLQLQPPSGEFAPVEKQITISANQTLTEHVTLRDTYTKLSISADLYPVEVYRDGNLIGTITATHEFRLKAGQAIIQIKAKGKSDIPLKPYSEDILLKESESISRTVKLIPEKAEISLGVFYDPKASYLVIDKNGKSVKLKGDPVKVYSGDYTVTSYKWGFYDQQQVIKLQEGDRQLARLSSFQPIPESLMRKHSFWKYNSYGSLATLATSLGLTALFYFQADKAYADYQAASTEDEVLSCRDRFLSKQNSYNICLNVNILPALWFAYSKISGSKATRLVRSEMGKDVAAKD